MSWRSIAALFVILAAPGAGQPAPARYNDMFGAWSPDGRRIAFIGWTRAGAEPALYVVNVDGSGRRRLGQVLREVVEGDEVILGQDLGALQDVGQLADVAWPGVAR